MRIESARMTLASLLLAGAIQAASIPDLDLVPWSHGFRMPVQLVDPGAGSRFVVVEQEGRLVGIDRMGGSSRVVLLDITDQVNYGGEKGLLSVAFHPRFASNGRLFVNYTTGRDNKSLSTHVSEFKADPKTLQVQRDSERVLLEFAQPYANHNGGLVMFGPDGKLYVGNGDGGSANDPHNNGQRMDTLLGKILRIDVNVRGPDLAYGVPRDNPFVQQAGARPEIWAFGMRNPWRFSFDRETGDLYAGDVGQNNWEEVDLIRKGGNYGWRVMEGFHCTPKVNPDCDAQGYELPLLEYARQDGVSVTGGFVYRGRQHPALQGVYLYGDYGFANIWGVRVPVEKPANPRLICKSPQNISSFAEDRDGELYVVGYAGAIYRVRAR